MDITISFDKDFAVTMSDVTTYYITPQEVSAYIYSIADGIDRSFEKIISITEKIKQCDEMTAD